MGAAGLIPGGGGGGGGGGGVDTLPHKSFDIDCSVIHLFVRRYFIGQCTLLTTLLTKYWSL